MFLAIDMSQLSQIHLVLFADTLISEVTVAGQNADVLTVLADFLAQENTDPKDLQGVAVVGGEGTFTSTRLAITVANTLQYVHGTTLLEIRSGELTDVSAISERFKTDGKSHFISATYSAEPRIGKKK